MRDEEDVLEPVGQRDGDILAIRLESDLTAALGRSALVRVLLDREAQCHVLEVGAIVALHKHERVV